ncbi:MAG: capsule biosynthesis protein [Syntrophobacteraceae bacterium]
MKQTRAMKQSFLFLQGPQGPFFRSLGRLLMREGHSVVRVNFNGGDAFDWMGPEAVPFRGKAEDWPEFLAELFRVNSSSDLVLFGDCRPLHETAIALARDNGIRVHVFEEGYDRPNWVTLEQDGVNGNSSLPGDPAWYRAVARTVGRIFPTLSAGKVTRALMYRCAVYYVAVFAGRLSYPNFQTHRPFEEGEEVRSWICKFLRMQSQKRRDLVFQDSLLSSGRRFFLFGLQLGSDYQIRRHSHYPDMCSAIVEVLTSFANCAPADVSLLVKNHPLDPGIVDVEEFTLKTADRLGIRDRVLFTHGGVLPSYLREAQGTVVVNSTLGMASLTYRRPTMVLGRAVYNIPGLTHGGDLDSFWSAPSPPDVELYAAFKRVLIHETQINGSFYTNKGIRMVLPRAVERLTGHSKLLVAKEHGASREHAIAGGTCYQDLLTLEEAL